MSKHAWQLILACVVALALCVLVSEAVSAGAETSLPRQGGPFAWVEAASGDEILFKTQNGETIGGVPPRESNIPHLVLHKNGILNPSVDERALLVHVENITLPPMETCFATVTVKTIGHKLSLSGICQVQ